MLSHRIPITLVAAVAFGCSEGSVAPTADIGPMQASVGRVLHRVTLGSPDFCAEFGLKPSCDANFSLVALQGTRGVSGEWHDQGAANALGPGTGGVGIHAAVRCLTVIGNQAWIGGVITQSRETSWIGLPVATTVKDNGRSANDPPDQVSFTFFGEQICNGEVADTPPFPLLIVPQGQAVVIQ